MFCVAALRKHGPSRASQGDQSYVVVLMKDTLIPTQPYYWMGISAFILHFMIPTYGTKCEYWNVQLLSFPVDIPMIKRLNWVDNRIGRVWCPCDGHEIGSSGLYPGTHGRIWNFMTFTAVFFFAEKVYFRWFQDAFEMMDRASYAHTLDLTLPF